MTIPDCALPLLAAAPSRFTAERSALAQTLAATRAGEAAAVRKLRRPLGLAWLMNRLARDHAAELEGLLAAAGRLREGQRRALAGRGAEALRAAGAEVGERSRALRGRAAGILEAEGLRAEPGKLARLELLLRAAASSGAAVREALRRGALVQEPDVGGELSGLALVRSDAPGDARPAPPPPASEGPQARRRAAKARGRAEEQRTGEEEQRRSAERERRRDAELRRRAEERRVRERARAAARAEKEERAALAAEARARRAAEVARQSAERAAALRARADRTRAEAGADGTDRAPVRPGRVPAGSPPRRP